MNEKIPGVLDCKNKTIFAINKNSNVPLVIFKPFDKSLDNFLVPSKLKYTNKNYYIVINFARNDDRYRFPIGNLIYTIGEVNDEKANYEYILHCHYLNLKEPLLQISKTKMKKIRKITNIWDIISQEEVKEYSDYRNLKVYSIDPDNSRDIDDAISFHNNLIGIHIADVTFWLEKFNIEPHFFSTIYAPHRKINMIPAIIADNLASLVENEDRLSLTLWYNMDNDTYRFEKVIIKNKKNFTYDNFPTNHKLYSLSKKIGEKYKMDLEKWDTHKMIEAFMVLANNKTAEYISKQGRSQLFRNHKEKEHDIPINNIKNEKFKEFMNIYLSNSAEYSTKQGKHYGLNLNLYTHFTSPIRRMADIYIHQIIKGNIGTLDIQKCNADMKLTKKLKRDFERYDVIQKLTHTIQTEGYVISLKEDRVTVYFPELEFCDRFDILSNRLDDIDTEQMLETQRSKITILGKLLVTIAKRNGKLVYNF